MSDTYTNPLAFIFGTKPGGAVPTYEQLQTRRKIAAAMMSQRQPYPKNLGEGLAAIGEALGARGYYSSLESDEEAKGRQDQALLKGLGIGGDQQSPTTPPAVPSDTTPPVVTPPAATPPAAMSPRYAPSDDTDTTTAPPVAAIEKAITTPVPTQAVPPPSDNLTNTPASDQPPSTMFSPTPISQQPMSGLAPVGRDAVASTMVAKLPPPAPPDQRLAFNGQPTAAPQPAPITPAPPVQPQIRTVPTAPAPTQVVPTQVVPPQLRAPTTEPRPPAVPAPTPQMLKITAALATIGDPLQRSQLQQTYNTLQAQQKALYDQQFAIYQKDQTAWENAPQKQQELTKAAAEAEVASRSGGLTNEALLAPVIKSADAVKGLPSAAQAVTSARDMLTKGIYTGTAADQQLAYYKTKQAVAGLFGIDANDPRIANTEAFKATIMPLVAQARSATSGNANISDADIRLAMQAVGGDINLDAKTFPRVLDALERINTGMAIGHQQRVQASGLGIPQREQALQGAYGIPFEQLQQIIPPRIIQRLREHPETADEFDKTFRTRGLAASILGGG